MWKRWRTETVRWSAFFLIVAAIVIAFIAESGKAETIIEKVNVNEDTQLSVMGIATSPVIDKLKSVGSKAYIESRARSELLYLRPDEIRFEIENAELLDNYTPQEWNILMEQKALDNE